MKARIALLITVIVLGTIWVNHEKAQVAYLDEPCPRCYNHEVLDFGEREEGHKGHCTECGTEFYILPSYDND